MDTLVLDTRLAIRRMRKAPAFTAAVIVTLALGIGANTAIFGVIDSILIRPLPYPHAEALVSVWHTAPGMPGLAGGLGCSPSMYFTYREENRTFQQFGLWEVNGASLTGVAEPEMPRALFVTYGLLDAVGREATSGPLVFAGGRHAGLGRDGHAHLRLLAAPLRGRHLHRRAHADDRFEAAHRHRRDACGIPLSARPGTDSSLSVRTKRAGPGTLWPPGYCAPQTRRHDRASQRRCGSHAGRLVECVAHSAGNGSHGL